MTVFKNYTIREYYFSLPYFINKTKNASLKKGKALMVFNKITINIIFYDM